MNHLILMPVTLFSQDVVDVLDIYEESRVIHDDNIGYEVYPVALNDSTLNELDGYLRRQFAIAPEGRSPLEIIRNYENAIISKGGEILFNTRDPDNVIIEDADLHDHFNMNRIGHTRNYEYMRIRHVGHDEYLSDRIPMPDVDVYVALMSGRVENRSVAKLLISEYGVEESQIMPVGVGPAAPVLSNDTEGGRARNRRVEIVEM